MEGRVLTACKADENAKDNNLRCIKIYLMSFVRLLNSQFASVGVDITKVLTRNIKGLRMRGGVRIEGDVEVVH